MSKIDDIQKLIEEGVLGPEECPTEHFWHWPVLQLRKLPDKLMDNFMTYKEIRWYGED